MQSHFNREESLILGSFKGQEELLKVLQENSALLAGGAITSVFSSVKIRDFDIYFSSVVNRDRVLEFFEESEVILDFTTANAKSYRVGNLKIQLIVSEKLLLPIPETVSTIFDFTVCMGLYNFGSRLFYLDDKFLVHLSQRKIVFNSKTLYPISSLVRLHKYMKRGFTVSGIEFLKVGLRINSLEMKTYADLKEQIQGIDTMFLRGFISSICPDEKLAVTEYSMDTTFEYLDKYIDDHYERIFGTSNEDSVEE